MTIEKIKEILVKDMDEMAEKKPFKDQIDDYYRGQWDLICYVIELIDGEHDENF